MKPREKKPETVFRIIDRESGDPVGSYSRAYCDEYDFESAERARSANVHGAFKDRGKYKIAKYLVTYELIEDDVEADTEDDSVRAILLRKGATEDFINEFEAQVSEISEKFKNESIEAWIIQ